jgi:hypothetical protein
VGVLAAEKDTTDAVDAKKIAKKSGQSWKTDDWRSNKNNI